jgi:hypothetical protein
VERKKVSSAFFNDRIPLLIGEDVQNFEAINGFLFETPIDECSVSTHVARSRSNIFRKRWAQKAMSIGVTNEEDEDPDPAQAQLDAEEPRLHHGRDRISVRRGLESFFSIFISTANL